MHIVKADAKTTCSFYSALKTVFSLMIKYPEYVNQLCVIRLYARFSFKIPKQSQESKSVFHDGSRFFGQFRKQEASVL